MGATHKQAVWAALRQFRLSDIPLWGERWSSGVWGERWCRAPRRRARAGFAGRAPRATGSSKTGFGAKMVRSGVRGERDPLAPLRGCWPPLCCCGRRPRRSATGRVPPLYPLTRAHEGRAGMSAVDSATCWGRLGGAVAAGRRRPFVLAKCGIRFGADDGARAIGADDDVMLRPPRRRRATGSSARCGIERSAV
jgi:hypothetical protein